MYKKQRRDLYILPKGIDLSNKKSPAKRQQKLSPTGKELPQQGSKDKTI